MESTTAERLSAARARLQALADAALVPAAPDSGSNRREREEKDARYLADVAREAALDDEIRCVMVARVSALQTDEERLRLVSVTPLLSASKPNGQRSLERTVIPAQTSTEVPLFKLDAAPVWSRQLPPYAVPDVEDVKEADVGDTTRTVFVLEQDRRSGERIDALGSSLVGALFRSDQRLRDPTRADFAPDWIEPWTRLCDVPEGDYVLVPSHKPVHVSELRTIAPAVDWKAFPVRARVFYHDHPP